MALGLPATQDLLRSDALDSVGCADSWDFHSDSMGAWRRLRRGIAPDCEHDRGLDAAAPLAVEVWSHHCYLVSLVLAKQMQPDAPGAPRTAAAREELVRKLNGHPILRDAQAVARPLAQLLHGLWHLEWLP